MVARHGSREAGFTLIELMIACAVVAILAGIAIGQYRDYTRRAKLSEVILATSNCRTQISENYMTMSSAPGAGGWGCEAVAPSTGFVSAIRTSVDGAIRVSIDHLDPVVNGHHVHLVPVHIDGSTPLSSASDLGRAVPHWLCGSDVQVVRNALPSNCRADTSAYSGADFE